MSTPNGYDSLWIMAINRVMEDREADVRISDIDDGFWDSFIGPLCDSVEDGYRLAEYRVEPPERDAPMDIAQRGSIAFAIDVLARALANDDASGVAVAQTQLAAMFAPAP